MTSPFSRAAPRRLRTAWHVLVHTLTCIAAGAACAWRCVPWGAKHTYLARVVLGAVADALNPREHLDTDTDTDCDGQRRRDLNRAARRRRRTQHNQRRREVEKLLRGMGGTPYQVAAALARHALYTHIHRLQDPFEPPESYLAVRLRTRDPRACHELMVAPWATRAGGTWVATPAPVRAYLHNVRRFTAARRVTVRVVRRQRTRPRRLLRLEKPGTWTQQLTLTCRGR